MSVYKRGKKGVYYMNFNVHGIRIFRSTGKFTADEAREVERKLKSEIAKKISSVKETDLIQVVSDNYVEQYKQLNEKETTMKDRELKNAMKVIDMRKKIVDQMIVAFDGKSMTPLFIKRNAKSPLSHYIDLRGERLDRKYYQVVAHAKELKIPDNQMDAVRAMFDCFHDSSKTVEAEVIRQPKQRKERVMQKIEEVKVIRQDTVYVGEKSLKKMLGGGKKATMHLHKDCTGLSVTRYGAVDIMELKVEEQKKIVSELRECTICNGTSLRGKYSRGRIGKYTGGLTVEEKMAELKGIKIEKPVAPVVHVAALKEVQESALEKEAVIETCGVYTVREFGYFERLNGKFTTITIMFDENMDIHAGDQIRIEKIS